MSQHPSHTDHHMSAPYDKVCHRVKIVRDSVLYILLQSDVIGVNSYHHQALKTLAPSLKAMAVSEDGLIEAVCVETKHFIWAVQWHPEFSQKNDVNSQKIFAAFVEHC